VARALLTENETFEVCETDLEVAIATDKGVFYTLRPITIEKAREIRKRHTKRVINRTTHQKDEVVDTTDVTNDLLDYALCAWRGIEDKGQAVECSLVNKLRLPPAIQSGLLDLAQSGQQTKDDKEQSFRPSPTTL
jgi:hypothetical protein